MDFHYVAPIRVRDGLSLLRPIRILYRYWLDRPVPGARSGSPIPKSTLQIQRSVSFELSLCSNMHNDSMCHRHAVPNSGAERRGHDRTGNQDTKVCGGGLFGLDRVLKSSNNILVFLFPVPISGCWFSAGLVVVSGAFLQARDCKTLAQYFYPRRARAYPPLSRCRR